MTSSQPTRRGRAHGRGRSPSAASPRSSSAPALAYWMYVLQERRARARARRGASPGSTSCVLDKWRVDELYDATVIARSTRSPRPRAAVDKWIVDGILARLTALVVAAAGHDPPRLPDRRRARLRRDDGRRPRGASAGSSSPPHADATRRDAGNGDYVVTAAPGMGYAYRWDADGDGKPDNDDFGADATLEAAPRAGQERTTVNLEVKNAFGLVGTKSINVARPARRRRRCEAARSMATAETHSHSPPTPAARRSSRCSSLWLVVLAVRGGAGRALRVRHACRSSSRRAVAALVPASARLNVRAPLAVIAGLLALFVVRLWPRGRGRRSPKRPPAECAHLLNVARRPALVGARRGPLHAAPVARAALQATRSASMLVDARRGAPAARACPWGATTTSTRTCEWMPRFGIHYHVAIDGISLWLVLLTASSRPSRRTPRSARSRRASRTGASRSCSSRRR